MGRSDHELRSTKHRQTRQNGRAPTRGGRASTIARRARSVTLALGLPAVAGALVALATLGSAGPACVPSGSAPPYDAGHAATTTPAPSFKPSLNVMTEVFDDDFDRKPPAEKTSAATTATPHASAHDGGGAAADGSATAAADDDELGPAWYQANTRAWRIENGRLCGQGAHNHGVWLRKVLPINARIEFDAIAESSDGDLKTEVWGDGQSAATAVSYTNATSYLAILGGWKNSLHVLARINEHGTDRQAIPVDKESDDPRQRAVVKGQVYHFKIERSDGKSVHWAVDGVEYLTFVDPAPLVGFGHDHFGFNDWEAKVCFDNVKVTPL